MRTLTSRRRVADLFALAAYVAVDAVLSLLGLGEARPSLIGIVLAAASLVDHAGAVLDATPYRP